MNHWAHWLSVHPLAATAAALLISGMFTMIRARETARMLVLGVILAVAGSGIVIYLISQAPR